MKRKIFLICLMLAFVICVFTVVAYAQTPSRYIEFQVKLGSIENDYVTVYTENKTGSTPKLDLSADLFSDVEFTTAVDKNEIVAIDLSTAIETNTANGSTTRKINYFATPSTPLAKCEEIKWFTTSGSQDTVSMVMFQNWTALKRFDFGCVTKIVDKAFSGSGLVDLVIPSTINTIKSSAFSSCLSLKTVKFEGSITNLSGSTFWGCTALESVDFGQLTSISDQMFYKCSSLKSVVLPSTVKSIAKEPFRYCTSLKSVDLGQVTSMNYNAFSGCTSLVDIKFSTAELSIKGQEAFSGCTSLKYVKIPDTVVSLSYGVFSGCTALEFVELSGSTNVVDKMFNGCTSLKAVSIPEGVTLIEENAFKNCTALKAVYLPSTLTQIGDNNGWGYGAFDSCKNLYFVNEPFAVRDENGDWYGDSFVMPTEPEVYYMPSTLATIYGNEFTSCEQLNKYIVFPTTFTEFKTATGPFVGVGLNNKKGGVTLVFLGKMTKISYSTQDKRYNNITFVFAHSENTGIDTVTTWHIEKKSKLSNFYAYFCAGNAVYDLTSFGATSDSYDAKDSDFTKTVYKAEEFPHFLDPSAPTSSDATCTEGKMTFKTCFCGTKHDIAKDETAPALGHIYNLESITDISYDDYTKNGKFTCGCNREGCEGVKNEEIDGSYLFTYLGYSKNAYGDMCVGYTFNEQFISYYKSLNEGFSFGMVTTIIDFDENGMIEGEDTPLAPDYNGTVINVDLTDYTGLACCDMLVKGFGTNEAYNALRLAMNMYVIDGESTLYIWDKATKEGTVGTHAVVNYEQYSAL